MLFMLFPLLAYGDNVAQKPTYPPVPDEIKTSDYHDYTGCKLLKVEPDGVVIIHKLGVAKLMFAVMPTDFQKAYGYDPVKAKTWVEAQQAQAQAVSEEQKIAAQKHQAEIEKNSKTKPEDSDTMVDLKKQLDALGNQIDTLTSEIAQLLRDSAGKGRYEKMIADDRSQIGVLRKEQQNVQDQITELQEQPAKQ